MLCSWQAKQKRRRTWAKPWLCQWLSSTVAASRQEAVKLDQIPIETTNSEALMAWTTRSWAVSFQALPRLAHGPASMSAAGMCSQSAVCFY